MPLRPWNLEGVIISFYDLVIFESWYILIPLSSTCESIWSNNHDIRCWIITTLILTQPYLVELVRSATSQLSIRYPLCLFITVQSVRVYPYLRTRAAFPPSEGNRAVIGS